MKKMKYLWDSVMPFWDVVMGYVQEAYLCVKGIFLQAKNLKHKQNNVIIAAMLQYPFLFSVF